jgi:hypothetical protein
MYFCIMNDANSLSVSDKDKTIIDLRGQIEALGTKGVEECGLG